MPNEPGDLDNLDMVIEQTRKLFRKLPPSIRPQKGYRSVNSRTPEEARALARAVYFSVKKAEEDGYITKVPGGYKMQWTAAKK
ncbi:MAG TPA: hypothetical protein PKA28_09245 [Methylomusa anaerophila]|uniref:Uncharacterized protein n=1 Tax=Methylomusa anaerophila TaxID=1930071 RepID=A0A348AKP6_9FIRM|nr:hypothetical protein [Methylomusa anaerophila]BBB91644.1 hypothetical protein MAMMFC1_02328 [Methylomusa anaerophila]HML88622.1 hypothetical protein [Methylomusa anaerophila]